MAAGLSLESPSVQPNHRCTGHSSVLYYQIQQEKVAEKTKQDTIDKILNAKGRQCQHFAGLVEQFPATRRKIQAGGEAEEQPGSLAKAICCTLPSLLNGF